MGQCFRLDKGQSLPATKKADAFTQQISQNLIDYVDEGIIFQEYSPGQCSLKNRKSLIKSQISVENANGYVNQKVYRGMTEDRQEVYRREEYPFSAIGDLHFKSGNIKYGGTAFLIGPNKALTCAHNIISWDKSRKKRVISTEINFYIRKENSNTGVYSGGVVETHFPEQYIEHLEKDDQEGSYPYDYALLQLDKNLGQTFGFFGLNFQFNNFQNSLIYLCGYPDDKGKMLYSKGSVQHLVEGRLRYTISTSKGNSGSPIYYFEGKDPFVIGIHTNSNDNTLSNEGVLLNNKILNNLNIWSNINYKALNLQGRKHLNDQAIQTLKNYPLEKLRMISLQKCSLTVEKIFILYQAKWSELKCLVLSHNYISEGGGKVLAMCSWPKLEELHLSHNCLLDEGIKELKNAKWPFLSYLDLSKNGLTSKAMEQLREASWPIKTLVLDQNRIEDEGVRCFNPSKTWRLIEFCVKKNGIESDGIEELAKKQWINKLKILWLSSNKLNKNSMLNCSFGYWERLQELYLQGNELLNESMGCIAGIRAPQIKVLSLQNTQITSQGIKKLVQGKWPELECLYLNSNEICDEGLLVIQTANWNKLTELRMAFNILTKEGVMKALKKRWTALSLLSIQHNLLEDEDLREMMDLHLSDIMVRKISVEVTDQITIEVANQPIFYY